MVGRRFVFVQHTPDRLKRSTSSGRDKSFLERQCSLYYLDGGVQNSAISYKVNIAVKTVSDIIYTLGYFLH